MRKAEAMDPISNTPEWLGESREYRAQVSAAAPAYRPSAPDSGIRGRAFEPARDLDAEFEWDGRRDLATPHTEGRAPEPREPMRGPSPVTDTLQQSRERVAAQWYALRGLMGHAPDPQEIAQHAEHDRSTRTPMLILVSMAGGVGKTSLVATLGRVLSSMGEKVLLADTSAHGLLPYYFGARESRPDVVRTFSPPPGSPDAPVSMVNYVADRLQTDEAGQTVLLDQLDRDASDVNRILLDLSPASMWLVRRLGAYSPSVLVPISPDINSVLSINAMERALSGTAHGGRPVQPYFVMTHFDSSLPLHLDVREALRRQLGERLLTWTVRRSQVVSEALAEGMTVVDYAPEASVTQDYTRLAEWVRHLSAPQAEAPRKARWSER